MGLLINQGKHDMNNNQQQAPEIIVANNVRMGITKIELDKYKPEEFLRFTFKIIGGEHNGKFVFDSIPYNPSSNLAWKYTNLRASAGVPYNSNESTSIDIEALLLNRVVLVDLSSRDYTSKDGVKKQAQNVKYKPVDPVKTYSPAAYEQPTSDGFVEVIDDVDLPFKESVTESAEPVAEVKTDETFVEQKPTEQKPVEQSAKPSYDDWD